MKTTNAPLMPRLHAVLRNDLLKPNAHNPSSGRDYFPMTALATLNYPACRRPTLPCKGGSFAMMTVVSVGLKRTTRFVIQRYCESPATATVAWRLM